jgi:leader peptidase (prepilin peptidase)/N-methyltransferase
MREPRAVWARAIGAALALAAVVVHVGTGHVLVALAAVVVVEVAAAVDRTERRIPNAVVVAGSAAMLLVVPLAGAVDDRLRAAVVGAALGALCYAGPLLALHLAAPGGIGFGDVKLAFVLGAGLGAGHVVLAPLGLLAACVAALARRAALHRLRGPEPFAPAMAAGVAAVLLVARPLVDGLGFRWFA